VKKPREKVRGGERREKREWRTAGRDEKQTKLIEEIAA
jgi:hypothetical protein